MAIYDLTPRDVPKVETKYRSIRTKLPVPESLPIFAALQESEPRSTVGQPPIVWDKAEDFIVSDRWGNRWIDWSSGEYICTNPLRWSYDVENPACESEAADDIEELLAADDDEL